MQQGGIISISASTVVGTVLAILAGAVAAAPAQAQAVGRCGTRDPTGYFGGVATSQQSGQLEVSLNLQCADGRYDGVLVTPLGTFEIRGGSADSAQVHLVFAIG